jgi:hypothetical protein
MHPTEFARTPLGSRLRLFESVLVQELADERIEAPWTKLVIRVGQFTEPYFGDAVAGVAVANVPADLDAHEGDTCAQVRRFAGRWILDGLHAARASGTPIDSRLVAIIERLSTHSGPFVHEPSHLKRRDRRSDGREFRTRFTRDEHSLTIELVCFDQNGSERGRAPILRLDGAWDVGYDFNPRAMRLTDETVEYLGHSKRILRSIPRTFCS